MIQVELLQIFNQILPSEICQEDLNFNNRLIEIVLHFQCVSVHNQLMLSLSSFISDCRGVGGGRECMVDSDHHTADLICTSCEAHFPCSEIMLHVKKSCD